MPNSVGYYNFKKITGLLQLLSNRHKQIQSYGIGDIKQLMYYVTERLKQDNTEQNLGAYYPLMYVIPQGAQTNGRQTVYTFNILMMDILNTKNFDNEIDVWSDTLDILKDVVSQLKYSLDECYTNWDLQYPIDFLPFSESYDDYVSGWNASIKLVIPDAIDRCDAPFEDFPPCLDYSND
jgi:hypothetical protein